MWNDGSSLEFASHALRSDIECVWAAMAGTRPEHRGKRGTALVDFNAPLDFQLPLLQGLPAGLPPPIPSTASSRGRGSSLGGSSAGALGSLLAAIKEGGAEGGRRGHCYGLRGHATAHVEGKDKKRTA